jgi:lysozyme
MTRDLLIAQLKLHEGSGPKKHGRFMPYKDTKGILSIGWGRNLDANGLRESEAELCLNNDLDDAIHTCFDVLPWFRTLDTVRQAVVTELMFNMGWGTFQEFTQTLRAIGEHDFAKAAEGLRQSKWYRDVKERRGKRLATVMETGQW